VGTCFYHPFSERIDETVIWEPKTHRALQVPVLHKKAEAFQVFLNAPNNHVQHKPEFNPTSYLRQNTLGTFSMEKAFNKVGALAKSGA